MVGRRRLGGFVAATLLMAGGCGGDASGLLAPPPERWSVSPPDAIAAAFASDSADKWERFGAASGPHLVEGEVIEAWQVDDGAWQARLRGGEDGVIVGGLYVPSALEPMLQQGRSLATFCKGVMIAPSGDESVLMSQCWLDRRQVDGGE